MNHILLNYDFQHFKASKFGLIYGLIIFTYAYVLYSLSVLFGSPTLAVKLAFGIPQLTQSKQLSNLLFDYLSHSFTYRICCRAGENVCIGTLICVQFRHYDYLARVTVTNTVIYCIFSSNVLDLFFCPTSCFQLVFK